MQISTLMYLLVFTTALICAGYNWMYKKEIHRMERQVGIVIPASLIQLLSALISISLFIATASLLLFSITSLLK